MDTTLNPGLRETTLNRKLWRRRNASSGPHVGRYSCHASDAPSTLTGTSPRASVDTTSMILQHT